MLNPFQGVDLTAPADPLFAPGTFPTDPETGVPMVAPGTYRTDPDGEPPLSTPDAPMPDPQVSASGRARILCALGRFGEAAEAANEAIAVEPRDLDAWCVMTEAQLGCDDPGAALRSATTVIEIAPEDERGHRLSSEALAALGRDSDAADAARAAVRCAPGSWEAHARVAHALITAPDRFGEAEQAARRAIELAPEQAGPHLALGAVAVAAGRDAEAISAYCSALGADPQCFEAHSRLSRLQPEPSGRGSLRWPGLRRDRRRRER